MLRSGRRRLLKTIDRERVLAAIREAERRTSGEIRVSVAPFFWGNVRKVAERAFVRLKMGETRDRNGILFFIVPARRRFAVLGDSGIHAKVGQEFWDLVAGLLSESFRKKEYTEGIVRAIGAAGEKLAEHCPYDAASDINELPDDIDFAKPSKNAG
jgi:uncharacterized membrane protein